MTLRIIESYDERFKNLANFEEIYTQECAKLNKFYGIYCFKNTCTDYIYIGKSSNLNSRIQSYLEASKRMLWTKNNKQLIDDISFYGWRSFNVSLLVKSNSRNYLKGAEERYFCLASDHSNIISLSSMEMTLIRYWKEERKFPVYNLSVKQLDETWLKILVDNEGRLPELADITQEKEQKILTTKS
jgi:hypothetical protein